MVKRKAKRKTKRKAVKRKTIKRRSKPKAVKRSLASRIYGAVKSYRTKRKLKIRREKIKARAKRSSIRIESLVNRKRERKYDKSTLAGGYSSKGYHGKDKAYVKTHVLGKSLVGKDRKPLKSIRGTVKFKKSKEGRKISFKPRKKTD